MHYWSLLLGFKVFSIEFKLFKWSFCKSKVDNKLRFIVKQENYFQTWFIPYIYTHFKEFLSF